MMIRQNQEEPPDYYRTGVRRTGDPNTLVRSTSGVTMPRCCVPSCNNHSREGVAFFRFRKEPSRRELWLKQIGRENWSPTDRSYIYTDHFALGSYEQQGDSGWKKLKNAVPTLFNLERQHDLLTRSPTTGDENGASSSSMDPSPPHSSTGVQLDQATSIDYAELKENFEVLSEKYVLLQAAHESAKSTIQELREKVQSLEGQQQDLNNYICIRDYW